MLQVIGSSSQWVYIYTIPCNTQYNAMQYNTKALLHTLSARVPMYCISCTGLFEHTQGMFNIKTCSNCNEEVLCSWAYALTSGGIAHELARPHRDSEPLISHQCLPIKYAISHMKPSCGNVTSMVEVLPTGLLMRGAR